MLGDMCSMFSCYIWANMYVVNGSVEDQCLKRCSMNVEIPIVSFHITFRWSFGHNSRDWITIFDRVYYMLINLCANITQLLMEESWWMNGSPFQRTCQWSV